LNGRQIVWHGFAWGLLAGTALTALMYLAAAFLGLTPLPQALSQPFLSVLPGPIFGFLIDTLQHAGKVVEEMGFIIGMIVALGVLGAAWAWSMVRWPALYSHYLFAAFGWLVVALVVLPISGMGLLGLNDGLATPFVWAALFAVYAFVLSLAAPTPDRPTDFARRRLLSTLPLTIGALSVGALALRLLPDWYGAVFAPPGSNLHGLSPDLTPVKDFYVVSKNFMDPQVDSRTWRLQVGGLVSRPLNLSLSDLRALPSISEDVTLECISNNVGGGLISTGHFTGVSLKDLLSSAAPSPQATWVAFKAVDGYTESLPLAVIMSSPEIQVAYDLDGAPLPTSHGSPARILIPGRYGMKGPKWLSSIDLVVGEAAGYWETQGWDHNAIARTTSRFDVPADGDTVKLGAIPLGGIAYAGVRGISKVEWSADGGATWHQAVLQAPLSPYTWVLWSASWSPTRASAYRLQVRATDGKGAVQQSSGSASFPSGASGYHTINVNVG
jgi:DMSO/TMAO reductase YedYZ molybdopterin-dependent catalytic subunit